MVRRYVTLAASHVTVQHRKFSPMDKMSTYGNRVCGTKSSGNNKYKGKLHFRWGSPRGRQTGITLQWRAGDYRVEFLPKVKIEVVVLDEDLGKALNAIIREARTGEIGDGKIFVLPVENAVRIRTGDEGESAI